MNAACMVAQLSGASVPVELTPARPRWARSCGCMKPAVSLGVMGARVTTARQSSRTLQREPGRGFC